MRGEEGRRREVRREVGGRREGENERVKEKDGDRIILRRGGESEGRGESEEEG